MCLVRLRIITNGISSLAKIMSNVEDKKLKDNMTNDISFLFENYKVNWKKSDPPLVHCISSPFLLFLTQLCNLTPQEEHVWDARFLWTISMIRGQKQQRLVNRSDFANMYFRTRKSWGERETLWLINFNIEIEMLTFSSNLNIQFSSV